MFLDRKTWFMKMGSCHKALLKFNIILMEPPVTGVRAHAHTQLAQGVLQCSWRERYLAWQK